MKYLAFVPLLACVCLISSVRGEAYRLDEDPHFLFQVPPLLRHRTLYAYTAKCLLLSAPNRATCVHSSSYSCRGTGYLFQHPAGNDNRASTPSLINDQRQGNPWPACRPSPGLRKAFRAEMRSACWPPRFGETHCGFGELTMVAGYFAPLVSKRCRAHAPISPEYDSPAEPAGAVPSAAHEVAEGSRDEHRERSNHPEAGM